MLIETWFVVVVVVVVVMVDLWVSGLRDTRPRTQRITHTSSGGSNIGYVVISDGGSTSTDTDTSSSSINFI